MAMNTKEYDLIKTKFENCLMNLNLKYKHVDFGQEDDDVNYIIYINASKTFPALEALPALLYANIKENSITILVLNLYAFQKKERISPYYKLVNDVNTTILHGKFSVRKDIKQIIYNASIDCGDNFIALDEKKITILVDDFLENLFHLFAHIKRYKKND